MIVTLLGVRGSRPIAVMDKLRYGGNTTSFKIEVRDMPPIYVDGGTGLYEEGVRLNMEGIPSDIYILMTHTHWDHILSLPFFPPLYEPDCHVRFYAPTYNKRPFIDLMQGQHYPRAFPVPYNQLKARQTFFDAKPGDTYMLQQAKVSTYQLNHPGRTIGWRVDADDRTVVIITDNAPIENNYLGEGMAEKAKKDPKAFEEQFTEGLLGFIKDADLVIFDTHFTEEGIKNRRHWGHSTPEMAAGLCIKANVKRLVLHHHAPEDSDEDIEKKAIKAYECVKGTELQIEPAVEGMKIWL